MTSTKQFVWCGNQRCEVRDGSGNLLNQYFGLGQVNFSGGSGTSYYYTLRHDGSIPEMTNSSGTIVWEQSFDPYGVPTTIVNTIPADFGYAGMYLHQRSGLNLTLARAYSPSAGRWLSRDPIGEDRRANLYGYVDNLPVRFTDPVGLDPVLTIYATPGGVIGEYAVTHPAHAAESIHDSVNQGVPIGFYPSDTTPLGILRSPGELRLDDVSIFPLAVDIPLNPGGFLAAVASEQTFKRRNPNYSVLGPNCGQLPAEVGAAAIVGNVVFSLH